MAALAQTLMVCAASLSAAVDLRGAIGGLSTSSHIAKPTEPIFNVLLTGYGGPWGTIDSLTAGVVAEKLGAQEITEWSTERASESPMLAMGGHGEKFQIRWHNHTLPVNEAGARWPAEHLGDLATKPKYDAVILMGTTTNEGFQLDVAARNTLATLKDEMGPDYRYVEPLMLSPEEAGEEEADEEDEEEEQMSGKIVNEGPDVLVVTVDEMGPDDWYVEKQMSGKIVNEGPDVLVTTVNLGRFGLANLQGSNRSEGKEWSGNEEWTAQGGDYWCNEIYYRTLWYVRSQLVTTRTGALLPVLLIRTDWDVDRTKKHVEDIVANVLSAAYIAPNSLP